MPNRIPLPPEGATIEPAYVHARGVYEEPYAAPGGGVWLFAVTSGGECLDRRIVRNDDEYEAAESQMRRQLDVADPARATSRADGSQPSAPARLSPPGSPPPAGLRLA